MEAASLRKVRIQFDFAGTHLVVRSWVARRVNWHSQLGNSLYLQQVRSKLLRMHGFFVDTLELFRAIDLSRDTLT
jgi:hypothetical protein